MKEEGMLCLGFNALTRKKKTISKWRTMILCQVQREKEEGDWCFESVCLTRCQAILSDPVKYEARKEREY